MIKKITTDAKGEPAIASTALLACPLCGRAPVSGIVSSTVPGMEDCGYYAIECPEKDHFCGVHGDEKEACESIWNRRANT
jgi:hypothetical protein